MENKDKIEVIGRSLIAAIPYAGGTISSIWADISTERKLKRFEEFIKSFQVEIINHKEEINKQFVNKDDFLDLFENTARHIILERSDEKRGMFKNILFSSTLDVNADYDKSEKFIILLDRMTHNEILTLKTFFSPEKINFEKGNPIKDLNTHDSPFHHWGEFSIIELLCQLYPDIERDELLDSIHFLVNSRLINIRDNGLDRLRTNGNPITFLKDKISKKGKEFISYIQN